MKTLLLSVIFCNCLNCFGQSNSFDKFEQDTLTMPTKLSFNKCVILELDSAFIFIDYDFFKTKLSLERKGCNKRIRERRRLNDDPIVANQTARYQKQYNVLDSIYKYLTQKSKLDSFQVQYKVFSKTESPFGDFIPGLIEKGQCIVADKNFFRQSFLIRQIGWKKNGSFSSGSRLYFITGHTKHFWSKWDWST